MNSFNVGTCDPSPAIAALYSVKLRANTSAESKGGLVGVDGKKREERA